MLSAALMKITSHLTHSMATNMSKMKLSKLVVDARATDADAVEPSTMMMSLNSAKTMELVAEITLALTTQWTPLSKKNLAILVMTMQHEQ